MYTLEEYDIKEDLKKLENLTYEQAVNIFENDYCNAEKNSVEKKIRFIQNENVTTIYTTDIEEAWSIIKSLQ